MDMTENTDVYDSSLTTYRGGGSFENAFKFRLEIRVLYFACAVLYLLCSHCTRNCVVLTSLDLILPAVPLFPMVWGISVFLSMQLIRVSVCFGFEGKLMSVQGVTHSITRRVFIIYGELISGPG
jgi:hypothetical protein